MNADQLKILFEEDDRLAEGVPVIVYWKAYSGQAVVKKLNKRSVTVELTEPAVNCTIPAGTEITVPRIDNIKKWTANNCVRLLQEGGRDA